MVVNKREKLIKNLIDNLDSLIGLVVMYRLKRGKNCTCNKGKQHICYYLSVREKGKTKNLYLPPKAVKEAKRIRRQYKKVKTILKEISKTNYEESEKKYPTGKPK